MGTPCPAVPWKKRNLARHSEVSAVAYMASPLWVGLLCHAAQMKRDTFWRTGNKPQEETLQHLQTTSGTLYLEPLQASSFASSEGICWLHSPTGKGRRGPRPKRSPRNTRRGTTEERSLLHEATLPEEKAGRVWRGLIYFSLCWDQTVMRFYPLTLHEDALARVRALPPAGFSSLPPNNF